MTKGTRGTVVTIAPPGAARLGSSPLEWAGMPIETRKCLCS